MRRTLKLAKREYLAAVRTKGFIITLVVLPIMMGGSGIAFALLKDRVSTEDKKIAVIDRSGVVVQALADAAEARNAEVVVDKESGRKTRPAYLIEAIVPNDDDPAAQRLELSNRVRRGEVHAFLGIGPDVLHPGEDAERGRITYHAENAALDEVRQWLSWPINNHLRQVRLADFGIDEGAAGRIFQQIPVEGMGLTSIDEDTGEVREAAQSEKVQAILIPMVMMMLMFMMIVMGAIPLVSSVQEEKSQRIAEVLLGSIKPFQFMMGKVLGGVAVSMTGIAVYVVGGIATLLLLDSGKYVPYDVLPWFLAFMTLAVFMLGALYAALGSMCNDAKEAQSATFPGMIPLMIPMFVMMPIMIDPQATFATWLSLFPPCTPMVMVLRLASPQTIPMWQPWLGLILVIATTFLMVWAGGRIFRIAILMQGTPPSLGNLLRWAVRG